MGLFSVLTDDFDAHTNTYQFQTQDELRSSVRLPLVHFTRILCKPILLFSINAVYLLCSLTNDNVSCGRKLLSLEILEQGLNLIINVPTFKISKLADGRPAEAHAKVEERNLAPKCWKSCFEWPGSRLFRNHKQIMPDQLGHQSNNIRLVEFSPHERMKDKQLLVPGWDNLKCLHHPAVSQSPAPAASHQPRCEPQILPPGQKPWVSLGPAVVLGVPGLVPRREINGTAADGRMHGYLSTQQPSACSLLRITSVASRLVYSFPGQPLIP
ncbi:hypothetical protein T4D_8085 [Trichinella pseudospiralis]|uniref:Uncharacterized protein n=1 Tax=Trichinella pseudospiralis TaxID=6337 RepID=A0A0V1G061_TRIPS|nr:hypothetical protein T4D_8085 [Trichinella pseudospiralis]